MIVFGVASTFGTVAFATEVSTDPQQPQQTQQQVIGRTPESAPPAVEPTPDPVSYTHLDVYKRQERLLLVEGVGCLNKCC